MDHKFKKLIIAGPCALESDTQIRQVLETLGKHGISHVRANIFKPRTSPKSFQGLGLSGLKILDLMVNNGFKPVVEVCSLKQLAVVKDHASIIQIGTRNMQNFELLKAIGQSTFYRGQEILLKRGFANTLEEWLCAAEYLNVGGVDSSKIILCERGSRSHCSPNLVVPDFVLAYTAKLESKYRVVIDPSHSTKDRRCVLPVLKASIAMGFDGALIEVHPNPDASVSDAAQAVNLQDFDIFMRENDCTNLEMPIKEKNRGEICEHHQ